jgi:uncharacterized cupin superfamily protein
VNIVELAPGEVSSDRHWHAESDEFAYFVEGIATVIEEDGIFEVLPGDLAFWPAGVENAHTVANRSGSLVRFLVAGTKPPTDLVRYPDSGETLVHEPPIWKIIADDGSILKKGKTEPDDA